MPATSDSLTNATDLTRYSTSIESFPPAKSWQWRGFNICYQVQGEENHGENGSEDKSQELQKPAVILVHGFGASWGHWRKVMPLMAESCRVYAIDLLGFGGSDKPTPGDPLPYTFETWGQQLGDFCREVVQTPAFLIGNSIGCIAAMQAAIAYPDLFQGVVTINCSVRMLHERRRSQIPWHQQLSTPIIQSMLGMSWFSRLFFSALARPRTVRQVLLQAYAQPDAVTDELVDILMGPAADPGAADVFAAFTRYSQGPLPEDLYSQLPCRALILWGQDDPWEPMDMAKPWADFDSVDDFVVLNNAGHCPQDEVPREVANLSLKWIRQNFSNELSVAVANP
ncbi:MAG: alpha/beta fold hydrolase [Cyanobacteria bacterium P01_F01_bin.150]